MTGVVEEQVVIPGGNHGLPGILAYPETGQPVSGLVVAGPHPFLGGQLQNNVVSALAGAGNRCGWMTLRFGYRASNGDLAEQMNRFWATGHAPQDGELIQDLRSALDFGRAAGRVTCLAGYSFGCWLVSRLLAEDGFDGAVVMVAPTIEHHDFSAMQQWDGPKLVIGSANDFATPAQSLSDHVAAWRPPTDLEMFDGAEHFFRGREDELAGSVSRWLSGLPGRCRSAGDAGI